MTAGSQSPWFDKPPVSQVTLEAHFDRLAKVRSAHYGLFWQAIGSEDKYPETDDLFPDEIEVEKPEADRDKSRIDFELLGRPSSTRTRFSNATSQVDIQDNALAAAWHGQPCSGEYPRYEHVREHFIAMLSSWRRVLENSRLGELHLVQAEIQYRNHLLVGHGWDDVDQVRGNVVKLDWLPTLAQLPTEDVHVYQRHVLRGDDGEFLGRLYMSVDSAREYEGTKSLAFALTVRRPLKDDTDAAVLSALDAGHELIVHTFANATTDRMHGLWQRREGTA